MDIQVNTMTELLRSLFHGSDDAEVVSDAVYAEDHEALYRLSKKHELAHLVGYALEKSGRLAGSVMEQSFAEQIFLAQYLCERYRYAFEQICECFEEAGIPFLPLKGLVIRSLYPEPWMRTSCDMDILVHPEDLEKACDLLAEHLQYRMEKKSSHEAVLSTEDGVTAELHYALVEENRAALANRVLEKVWEYSAPAYEGSCRYLLNDAMLYFYHIAHMAKHVEEGGCGMRSFLDLRLLMQNGFRDHCDVPRLLAEGGLTRFEDMVRKLSDVWFGCREMENSLSEFEKFIIGGGIYGSSDNRYAVRSYRAGGKRRYILSRVFLPCQQLKYQYPVLQGHRWMYPFCSVHRWFSMIFGKKKENRKQVLGAVSRVSDSKSEDAARLFEELGL